MDIDRITHCMERLERDLALANRLKILELKFAVPPGQPRLELEKLETEQAETDADRTGRYAERNSLNWDV